MQREKVQNCLANLHFFLTFELRSKVLTLEIKNKSEFIL